MYNFDEIIQYFKELRDERQKALPAEAAEKDKKMFNRALDALQYRNSHESRWDGDYYGEDC